MSKHDIKDFLQKGQFLGRRHCALLDEQEISLISKIIVDILKSQPEVIHEDGFTEFTAEDFYLDPVYYRPIREYLVKYHSFETRFNVPCPCGNIILNEVFSGYPHSSAKEIYYCSKCNKPKIIFNPDRTLHKDMYEQYDLIILKKKKKNP